MVHVVIRLVWLPPARLLECTPVPRTLTAETVVAQGEVLQLAQLAQLNRDDPCTTRSLGSVGFRSVGLGWVGLL